MWILFFRRRAVDIRKQITFLLVVLLTLAMAGCGTTYFKYHGVQFRENGGMQAQLGSLGIRGVDDVYGFSRAAALSQCGVIDFPLHVDQSVPQVGAVVTSFAGDASLSTIGKKLGYTRGEMEKMSLLVFTISPIELIQKIKTNVDKR